MLSAILPQGAKVNVKIVIISVRLRKIVGFLRILQLFPPTGESRQRGLGLVVWKIMRKKCK